MCVRRGFALRYGTHFHTCIACAVGVTDTPAGTPRLREPARSRGGVLQRGAVAGIGTDDTVIVDVPRLCGDVAVVVLSLHFGYACPRVLCIAETPLNVEYIGIAVRLVPLQEHAIGKIAF